MKDRNARQSVRAAVVNSSSGKAQRLEPVKISRLDKAQLIAVLEKTEIVPKGGDVELTSHVLLSAQVPWVAGKGHLNTLNSRSSFADGPSISWIPETGQPIGRLEIWLDGLAANASYLARIEVGSVTTSPIAVRAVTLGAGLVTQTFNTDGGFDTLILQFPSGEGGLGLIQVESADWIFYEVEVSRFEL